MDVNTLVPTCDPQGLGVASAGVSTILQFLSTAYCSIADVNWPKDDGPKFIQTGNNVYDFIIVGAGTAGPVVAGRLSENPNYRILIIEAGDDPPIESEIPNLGPSMQGSKVDWNYATKSNNVSCLGFPGGACQWPRGKMLGGCSALNGAIMIRGNRRDYNNWARLGNPSWDFESLLPYFRKTEKYLVPNPYGVHGEDGPLHVDRFNDFNDIKQTFIQGAKEAGNVYVDDFRDGHDLGYGTLNGLLKNNQRDTPAKAFLINHRPNLEIIKNAIVTKVNFDKYKRAESVNFVYTDKGGQSHHLVAEAKKEIILSAGTVDSAKLLMLSGVGPKKHLHSLGIPIIADLAVGQNLQDHPIVPIYFTFDGPSENLLDLNYNYIVHRTGRLAGVNMLDLAGFFDIYNKTGLYPDLQVLHAWVAQGGDPFLPATNPVASSILSQYYQKTGIVGKYMVVMNPYSKGSIQLASRDYQQQPIIDPNYLSDYRDVKLYIDGIRKLRSFEETPTYQRQHIKSIRIDLPACVDYPFDSDKYWECYIRQSSYLIFHPVGTVKMGPDNDREAVVDSRLRVKGVKGLRVIDASIMPKIVSANTMGSTIMIGEKGADFIKEDHQK